MIAQVIKNQYDKNLVEYNLSLKQVLETPLRMSKDDLPQWQFIKLLEGANRHRRQDNYATRHALILDIDKNWNIADFERTYSNLTYAIHTTSNHTMNANRFRVILPLDAEYPNMLFRHKPVHEALAHYFPGFDPSSLVNFHKLPALPANPSDYYCSFNSGRRFGYSDIKAKVEEIELSNEIEKRYRESKNQINFLKPEEREFNVDRYIDKWVIGRLDEVDWYADGSGRHSSIVSFCGSWGRKSDTEGKWIIQPILNAIDSYNMPSKYKKIARKMLR